MDEFTKSSSLNLRSNAVLLLLTVLILLPFTGKPFHLDDPVYIWVAQQIHEKPLDFFGFEVNWDGAVKPAWDFNKNPPGVSYFIALAACIVGWSEQGLHLAFLVPAIGAILGTYRLAKVLCTDSFFAAVTALATPVFLLSSTQLMCDTLLLCCWVWAVLFWMEGLRRNRIAPLLAAGLLIGIAGLTKYSGLSLVPLLFAYSCYVQRSIGWWMLAFLVPIGILGTYEAYTATMYGEGMLTMAMNYVPLDQPRPYFARGLIAMIFLGGCIAPVLFYSPWLCSARQLLFLGVMLILVAGTLPMLEPFTEIKLKTDKGIMWSLVIQMSLFTCAGCLILYLATVDLWKNRDSQSILLWLWVFGVFAFTGFVNWTVNGRSILPMVPAVSILLVRRMGNGCGIFNLKMHRWRYLAVLSAAAFALIPTYADYQWANSAKQAAQQINKIYSDESQQIWFQGHWGFQWYMESLGANHADRETSHSSLQSGDLLVIPFNNYDLHVPPRSIIATQRIHTFAGPNDVSTICLQTGAGFYSDEWGPLPYAFGRVTPQSYAVLRMR